LMQFSQLQTARTIYSSKSVGQLSPIPFVSLVVNCVVWGMYGILLNDPTVLAPNISGLLIGLICTTAYWSLKPIDIYICIPAVLVMMVSTVSFVMGNSRVVGLLGCGIAIVLGASPLAVIRTIITEKSTAALPFAVSIHYIVL
jgi:solute carrier family 50 protein (sugar transporter)